MRKIESIDDLKRLASQDGGLECFIALDGGLKSSKHISYDDGEFYIDNYIDGSEQTLNESELAKETNIVEAIEKGALFAED